MQTRRLSETITSTEHVEIATVNGKIHGASITRATIVFVPEERANVGYSCFEPRAYLAVCTQATRNGQPFGATQGWRYFDTEAAREAAVAVYLKRRQRAGR